MEIQVEEVLRYLGAGHGAPAELRQTVEQMARQISQRFAPRWVYRVCEITHRADGVFLLELQMLLTGQMAAAMLAECHHAALLACTAGAEFDAFLRAEQARDMSRAVIVDACGGALAEAGCDAAEQELSARFPNQFLTDRFSPGYGDLPLNLQPGICDALNAQRRIGITVGSSFLMNPCKSVTAVIGIADHPQPAKIRGCAYCNLQARCLFRKRGQSCGNCVLE